MKKVLIFGGTGFIGRALIGKLKEDGNYIILVTRNGNMDIKKIYGVDEILEYKNDLTCLDSNYIETIDVIINLAGENIFGFRWTHAKKKRILESREKIIKLLKTSMEKASAKIPLLIQTSAVGFYGYCDSEQAVDENSCCGEDFLAQVCTKLEKEVENLNEYFDRIAIIRLGIVLGNGGFLKQIAKSFFLNIGVEIGKGNHWFTWIHIDDVVDGIRFIMDNEHLKGPINFVATESIKFSQFTQILRKIKNNKIMITIPSQVGEILLGEMSEPLSDGIKVEPRKLIKNKYEYQFTDIEDALRNILISK